MQYKKYEGSVTSQSGHSASVRPESSRVTLDNSDFCHFILYDQEHVVDTYSIWIKCGFISIYIDFFMQVFFKSALQVLFTV